jgi:hypothetical protein
MFSFYTYYRPTSTPIIRKIPNNSINFFRPKSLLRIELRKLLPPCVSPLISTTYSDKNCHISHVVYRYLNCTNVHYTPKRKLPLLGEFAILITGGILLEPKCGKPQLVHAYRLRLDTDYVIES